MTKAALITAVVLLATGLGGFAAAGFAGGTVTALIPAAFGLLIGLCGVWGRRESRRRAASRTAAVLALLGFLLPVGRLAMVLSKGSFTWDLRSASLVVMAATCLAFLVVWASGGRSRST